MVVAIMFTQFFILLLAFLGAILLNRIVQRRLEAKERQEMWEDIKETEFMQKAEDLHENGVEDSNTEWKDYDISVKGEDDSEKD